MRFLLASARAAVSSFGFLVGGDPSLLPSLPSL